MRNIANFTTFAAASVIAVLSIVWIAMGFAPREGDDAHPVATLAPGSWAIDADGHSFVGGNPNGDVTVVEFFDYRCGYCRKVRPDVLRLITEDSGVRLVMKEYPVLGKNSFALAKVAMAALQQDGSLYWKFHNALMSEKGVGIERALEIASGLGLDATRLRAEMDDPKIAANISANMAYGHQVGAGGTPAFLIGNKFLPGAISLSDMRRAVAAMRAAPQS